MKITTTSNGESSLNDISFNLIERPWIPVVDVTGQTMTVGLRELFERVKEFSDLATGTLETIALYRMLLCIAQRALDGPQNEEEWKTVPQRLTKVVIDYLECWKDRFDLFGKRPFLQIANLTRKDSNKTDKLDFGLAAGSASTFFDQNAIREGRVHKPEWLAIKLITYQNFSGCGFVGGVAKVGDYDTKSKSGTASPCAEKSMLLTVLKGDKLTETICWNLLTRDNVNKIPWGKPVWEYDDYCDAGIQDEISKSFLGRLVPLSRFVKLDSNCQDVILARGIEYCKFTASSDKDSFDSLKNQNLTGTYREPMATIYVNEANKNDEENWKYLDTVPERSPWRDLYSILAWDKEWLDQFHALGANVLSNLRWINEKPLLLVAGIKYRGNNSTKVINTVHWITRLNKKLCNKNVLSFYKKGVRRADLAEKYLERAIYTYYETLMRRFDEKKTLVKGANAEARRLFWSRLERYQTDLRNCAEKCSLSVWKGILNSVLFTTYEQCCLSVTPQQILAFAKGRKILQIFVKRYVPRKRTLIKKESQTNQRRLISKNRSIQTMEDIRTSGKKDSKQMYEKIRQKTLFDFMD